MTQLAQRLCFNLTNTFACDCERLSYFFKRVLAAVLQPEAHLDHLLFPRSQRAKHLRRLILQVDIDHGFRR